MWPLRPKAQIAIQGVTYSDTTVYTKQAFSTWLAARYSNNIAALNSAWNSNYSTFGASGAGWGVGSGIIDENGTCPSKSNGQSCWVGNVYTLAGETTTMQSDMSAFYVYYLDQYFSVMQSRFSAAAPGVLLQMQLGGWGAPPRKEVLTEAAQISHVAYSVGCSGMALHKLHGYAGGNRLYRTILRRSSVDKLDRFHGSG